MKQGILVNGILANIKSVESKEYGDKVNPAHQKLQITVLNDDGLSIIDVKDNEMKFSKESVGKPIEVSVAYTIVNNNAYFRLV